MRVVAKTHNTEVFVNLISDNYIKECDQKEIKANKESAKLISYLGNAYYIIIRLNLTNSLFDGTNIESSHTLLSDGEWIWSADLNHYSEKHSFIWPNGFLESVKAKNYKMPELTETQIGFLGLLANDIKDKFMSENHIDWLSDRTQLITPKINTYHVNEL